MRCESENIYKPRKPRRYTPRSCWLYLICPSTLTTSFHILSSWACNYLGNHMTRLAMVAHFPASENPSTYFHVGDEARIDAEPLPIFSRDEGLFLVVRPPLHCCGRSSASATISSRSGREGATFRFVDPLFGAKLSSITSCRLPPRVHRRVAPELKTRPAQGNQELPFFPGSPLLPIAGT